MSFTRFTTNVQNITPLPDRVQNQAQQLKALFDKAGVDIKTALNALMAELEATSSANSLGATSTTTASRTIQGIISAFDTAISDRYTKNQTNTAISNATNNLVTSIAFNSTTGVFTITKKDGTTTTIDTAIEKVPATFELIESGGSYYLRITNLDGSYTQTEVTSLMNIYNFNNTDTIAFTKTTSGNTHTMTANVRDNSITMEKLALSAVTEIEGYVEDARDSATNAATSATNASNSATNARSWAEGGTNTRTGEDTDNAKYYSTQSSISATAASESATSASGSATTASGYATAAGTKASEASASATSASNSATTSASKAIESQSWAVGGTGTRTGEDTNNAKYWCEQAEGASQGGDMRKEVYDANNNGVVDNAEKLEDHPASYFAPATHTHEITDVAGLQSTLNGKQSTLVSGTNIKTVNGTSILGSGNISVSVSASSVTAGTLGGQTVANATAVATLGTKQVRNIYAGTTDMTPGTTALTTGDIYLLYEA